MVTKRPRVVRLLFVYDVYFGYCKYHTKTRAYEKVRVHARHAILRVFVNVLISAPATELSVARTESRRSRDRGTWKPSLTHLAVVILSGLVFLVLVYFGQKRSGQ